MMEKRALILIVLVAVLTVNGVIEKTLEDAAENRRIALRNRTTVSKVPLRKPSNELNQLTISTTTVSEEHIESNQEPPVRINNRSRVWHFLELLRPPRLHGSINLGPGLNVQVSGSLDSADAGAWWKGNHVCMKNETHEVVEKDDRDLEDGWKIWNHRLVVSYTCDDTESSYKCTLIRGLNGKTTKYTTIYECCTGYQRNEDEPGCSEEVEQTDLMSTLERLNLTEMKQALQMTGLSKLLNQENYTIFAPVNEAFKMFKADETKANIVLITPELINIAKDLDDVIVGHVIKGSLRMSDVEDEQRLNTELDEASIRINKYYIRKKKLLTTNCVLMITKDVPSINGMVHVVKDLLQPVTQNLYQLIQKNPQLSQFAQVMKILELEDDGQYTLFVPTNAAFDKLKTSIKDKIKQRHKCANDILKNHLLPNVICSSVIQNRAKTINVRGHYLTLTQQSHNLSVESASVMKRDVMATNGVMHIIDQVLLPDNVGDIEDIAVHFDASILLKLVQNSGLPIVKTWEKMKNFTMFLPSNEAIKSLPQDVLKSINGNVKEMQSLLDYHIVPQPIKYKDLTNDMKLPTMTRKHDLLVKEYHSYPFSRHSIKTVQCGVVVNADVNSCGDMIQVVNKFMLPPSGDVLHILEKSPEFSRLVGLVKSHNLEEILKSDDPFTFFAPTNQAFELFSADSLNKLQKERENVKHLLKSHMIADILCCAGILKQTFLISTREVNLDGWILTIERNRNVSVGRVPVVSCDRTATNGVVHGINQFVPAALHRYNIIINHRRRWSVDDIWKAFSFD